MADDDLDRAVAAAFSELDAIEPPDLSARIFESARGADTTGHLPHLAVGPRRQSPRRWVAAAAAAVVLFGAGLAVGLFLARDSGPDGPTPLVPAATAEPGTSPPSDSSVPPTASTSTTEVPSDGSDELTEALAELGAAVEFGATRAVTLDGALWCGVERAPAPDPTGLYADEGRRRCFLDGHLAAAPAVLVRVRTSTEGDSIIDVWRTLADGTIEVFTDAVRDSSGLRGWSLHMCDGLTTRLPGGRDGDPPTTFGCAEATDGPVVHTSEPMPEWFTSREVLPLCGYAVRLEDVDMAQRMCFRQAIEERQPAEFAYLDIYEGVRKARWFRVTSTGDYEVFVQTITEGAPGAVWERYACAVIGTVEGPGDTFDEMPVYRPEDCAVGADAEPPPTTTTTPLVTAPPGTFMASAPPTT